MEARVSKLDLILMHGPSFVGKGTFYTEKLSKTHNVLRPSNIFQEDSRLGLRDVGLEAYKSLKGGHKIVILDPNESKNARKSYISLLQKKCRGISIGTVNLVPKYGCQQLFWARELCSAALSLSDVRENKHRCDDLQILKWFGNETDLEINYRHGIVDEPSESEGDEVHRKLVGICTRSAFKFEVPALFLQWEFLHTVTSDDHRHSVTNLIKVCRRWSDVNPCGRIIIICDGSQMRTGEQSKSQQVEDIHDAVGHITKKFTDHPVYAIHIDDPKIAGRFIIPPKPGILAYLQRRHCLNLHARSTVYLYETSSHMKMADSAGVRHIKASRVLEHPSLVISSHAFVTPPIPDMLKTIKCIPDIVEKSQATIPMYNKREMFDSGYVHESLGFGRSEYLFADTWDVIERYQDLYCTLASRIGEPGSKMSPNKVNQSDLSKLETSPKDISIANQSRSNISISNQSRSSAMSRDLPKWMLGKEGSNSSRSSLDSNKSNSIATADVKIRKTMYVMTEKELVEVATEILRQAGKTDVINNFKVRQNEEEHIHRRQKKSSDPCNISVKKDKKHSKVILRAKTNNNTNTAYPKMEPDDDEDENNKHEIAKNSHSRKNCQKTKFSKVVVSKKRARLKCDHVLDLESDSGNSDATDRDRSTEASQEDVPESTATGSDIEHETARDNVLGNKQGVAREKQMTSHEHGAPPPSRVRKESRSVDGSEDEEYHHGVKQSKKNRAVIRDLIVTSVLDDFMTTNAERKNSPKKRAMDRRDKVTDLGIRPAKQRNVSSFLDNAFTHNTSANPGSCLAEDGVNSGIARGQNKQNLLHKSPEKQNKKTLPSNSNHIHRYGHGRKNSDFRSKNKIPIFNNDSLVHDTDLLLGLKEEKLERKKKRQTPDLSVLDDIFL